MSDSQTKSGRRKSDPPEWRRTRQADGTYLLGIYQMGSAWVRGAMHVQPREPIEDDFALLWGCTEVREPLVFEYHLGGRPRDFMGCGHAVLDLVSDRVTRILARAGFSGWRTFPARVYDRDGAEIPGYQGLIVTGRCGSTRANRVLPLDLQSWDGSDVFVREGTGEVYVTERVRNALEDARITNVAFEFVADAPSFAE